MCWVKSIILNCDLSLSPFIRNYNPIADFFSIITIIASIFNSYLKVLPYFVSGNSYFKVLPSLFIGSIFQTCKKITNTKIAIMQL